MATYSKGAGKKVGDALREMKEGKLKSGRSGKKVTNPKQAIAIGLSEARESGARVPHKNGAAKSGSKAGSKAGTKAAAKTKAASKSKGAAKTAARKGTTKAAGKKAAFKSGARTAAKKGTASKSRK
jgi:hypothetical protein